jgi:cytoskeleton protein RodZ
MSAGSLRGAMTDIGVTLREARMRARIDITEVERATKIRARYLRAMEHEEWDALPGPVYVKSFLRTYSDYLGLDTRMLLDEYKRRFERPSDHDGRSIATLHRERERAARGPLVPPWLLIGLVLVAVVVALYLVGTMSSKKPPTPPAATVPTTTTQTQPRAARKKVTLPSVPRQVSVKIVPTGQVYICMTDGAGKRLIPGVIYNAGQSVPTQKSGKLLLTLGNNSVQIKANGKTVQIPASASSIGLEFTPRATKPLAAAQQPRCA